MPPVILITGASRGIGAATAKLVAERGYAVAVNFNRSAAAAEAVATEITSRGGQALAIQADVSRDSEVQRLFQTIDRSLGPLSVLVNNAGILETQSRVEDITADRLERVLTTNVISSFLCSREAIRRMSTKRGGSGGAIVNISSVAATLGAPCEYVDYAASKAAVEALTIGLAQEVATEGIRVNAVRPGFIYIEIHAGGEPNRVDRVKQFVPMRCGGQPEEVAQAILWLASGEASYSTGTILDVSGGRR
jgi:NAD(P)-dependent dehydrogenase (short-subunit alcohol dehydrogenase family)